VTPVPNPPAKSPTSTHPTQPHAPQKKPWTFFLSPPTESSHVSPPLAPRPPHPVPPQPSRQQPPTTTSLKQPSNKTADPSKARPFPTIIQSTLSEMGNLVFNFSFYNRLFKIE